MENQGWIKAWRQMEDWEWYTTPNMAHLFQHLMRRANHEDKKWQGHIIKRGQLITSLGSLKKQTGISIKSSRTCLKRLEDTGEISQKTTNRFRLITICKYDTYQIKGQAGGKQRAGKGQTKGKQGATNKNVKNVKNDKNKYSDSFEIFWKAFIGRWNIEKGRHDKGGKMEAFEEWQKLNDQQQAKAMKFAPLTGSKITKDACRWLKYHRWEDFESDEALAKDTAAEQNALERKRQEIRKDESEYFREKTPEELRVMLEDKKRTSRRWLIKEIIAEKGK